MSSLDINYVKHSMQQVRKACAGCGSNKLYWAHEQVGKPNPEDSKWCPGCEAHGALVMVDMDTMQPHSCTPNPTGISSEGDGDQDGQGAEQDNEDDPTSELDEIDPWKQGAEEGEANEISAKLAAISEGNDQDAAAAKEEMEGVIEGIQLSGGSGNPQGNGENEGDGDGNEEEQEHEKPFPDDDEYVTHKEFNEFDPISRPEAAEAFNNVKDGMDKIHNMHIRQGGRIAQITTQMSELERRTRVTITINDVAAGTTYDLPDELHHCQLGDVIKIMSVDNCLMVGPAGSGKGEIAYQTASALGLTFYTMDQGSLSPQTPVSSLIGYMNSSGKYVQTTFFKAFKNGGLMFFDELDNAHPACLATVNAALAIRPGQTIGFPGGQMIKKHKNFKVLGAANTYGRGPDRTYTARQRGDAATWDRFSILGIKYDHTLEDVLCARTGIDQETMVRVLRYVRKLRSNIESHQQTIPAVIGMRGSEKMCALLHAGLDAETAIFARCRRGMSDQDWAKISAGATFKTVAESPPPTPLSMTNRPSPFGQNSPTSRPVQITGNGGSGNGTPEVKITGSLKVSDLNGNLKGRYTVYLERASGKTEEIDVQISPEVIGFISKGSGIVAIKEIRKKYPVLGLLQCKAVVDTVSDEIRKLWGVNSSTPSSRPEFLG